MFGLLVISPRHRHTSQHVVLVPPLRLLGYPALPASPAHVGARPFLPAAPGVSLAGFRGVSLLAASHGHPTASGAFSPALRCSGGPHHATGRVLDEFSGRRSLESKRAPVDESHFVSGRGGAAFPHCRMVEGRGVHHSLEQILAQNRRLAWTWNSPHTTSWRISYADFKGKVITCQFHQWRTLHIEGPRGALQPD